MKHRKIVVRSPGPASVLQCELVDVPVPQAGEVLVRVETAGVIWADIMVRRGVYPNLTPSLPYTPGFEIVGTIVQAGEGQPDRRIGERILALPKVGGYAEFLCLAGDAVVPVPQGVDPAEAVALGVNYTTAYQMLHRIAGAAAGEVVFFHGASGGVGTALLDLGAMIGVRMIGSASARKHELIARMGGTAIDYQRKGYRRRVRAAIGEGVDAVFDPLGGTHLWSSYRMLKPGGALVAYGEKSWAGGESLDRVQRAMHGFLLALLGRLPGGRRVVWYDLHPLLSVRPDWVRQDLTQLLEWLQIGRLHPVIGERLPLEQAARAHELLERGEATGKIVLLCR